MLKLADSNMHVKTDVPNLCNLADILEISKLLNRIGFCTIYPKFRYIIAVQRWYTRYLTTLMLIHKEIMIAIVKQRNMKNNRKIVNSL